MSPTPSTRSPDTAPVTAARYRRAAAIRDAAAAAVLLALAGCAQFAGTSGPLARQVHEISCISRCQTAKDHCDDNARFDYQQCEAGYQSAQRDFRWCNSGSEQQCGYPWWSCSENLYGYCTNRYRECSDACRQTQPWTGGSSRPRSRATTARE